MHNAFEVSPILEWKGLPFQIESMDTYGMSSLALSFPSQQQMQTARIQGTGCSLAPARASCWSTPSRTRRKPCLSRSLSFPLLRRVWRGRNADGDGDCRWQVDLQDTKKGFAKSKNLEKKPITQLAIIEEFDLLLSLIDGYVCVHDLKVCRFGVLFFDFFCFFFGSTKTRMGNGKKGAVFWFFFRSVGSLRFSLVWFTSHRAVLVPVLPQTYNELCRVEKSKGCHIYAVDVQVRADPLADTHRAVRDMRRSRSELVVRLAVAVKRRLVVMEWNPAAGEAGEFIETRELGLPDVPKVVLVAGVLGVYWLTQGNLCM